MSSSRAVNILFLSFMCDDIGVVMVTNMIDQLQSSLQARGRFFSNLIHKMAFLRCTFAVVEFFSPSLVFCLFGTENIFIIVFISPL